MPSLDEPDPNPFERLRASLPVVERWAYFDFAAVAPLPAPVRDVFVEWANDMSRDGAAAWGRWRKRIESTRRSASALLNADVAEVGLVRNTTEGIGLVAEGYPWRPGDNVVVPEGEFPTNLYPWLNLKARGVEVRIVPTHDERIDLASLARCCDAKTRIVAVSWVGYATGWRNDLAALCDVAHTAGALLCVDAIQGLGAFPLDVKAAPIDFLAADGHKWLLGPEGAGVLFVRHASLDILRPVGVGWNSVRQAGQFGDTSFELKPAAARYEGGSYPVAGMAALGTAIDLLLDIGISQVSERLLEITDELTQRLKQLGAAIVSAREKTPTHDPRSGIVAFTLPGVDPLRARERCLSQGVVLNVRRGALRVSPHVVTSNADLDRLTQVLLDCRRLP